MELLNRNSFFQKFLQKLMMPKMYKMFYETTNGNNIQMIFCNLYYICKFRIGCSMRQFLLNCRSKEYCLLYVFLLEFNLLVKNMNHLIRFNTVIIYGFLKYNIRLINEHGIALYAEELLPIDPLWTKFWTNCVTYSLSYYLTTALPVCASLCSNLYNSLSIHVFPDWLVLCNVALSPVCSDMPFLSNISRHSSNCNCPVCLLCGKTGEFRMEIRNTRDTSIPPTVYTMPIDVLLWACTPYYIKVEHATTPATGNTSLIGTAAARGTPKRSNVASAYEVKCRKNRKSNLSNFFRQEKKQAHCTSLESKNVQKTLGNGRSRTRAYVNKSCHSNSKMHRQSYPLKVHYYMKERSNGNFYYSDNEIGSFNEEDANFSMSNIRRGNLFSDEKKVINYKSSKLHGPMVKYNSMFSGDFDSNDSDERGDEGSHSFVLSTFYRNNNSHHHPVALRSGYKESVDADTFKESNVNDSNLINSMCRTCARQYNLGCDSFVRKLKEKSFESSNGQTVENRTRKKCKVNKSCNLEMQQISSNSHCNLDVNKKIFIRNKSKLKLPPSEHENISGRNSIHQAHTIYATEEKNQRPMCHNYKIKMLMNKKRTDHDPAADFNQITEGRSDSKRQLWPLMLQNGYKNMKCSYYEADIIYRIKRARHFRILNTIRNQKSPISSPLKVFNMTSNVE